MAENLPPVPTNFIDLSDKYYTNLAVNQLDFTSNIGIFWGYLSEWLHYGFYENMIVVQDFYHGIERIIVPKKPNLIINFESYACLLVNRGFVVYKTPSTITNESSDQVWNNKTSFWTSIISINFEDSTYELVGKPRKLFFADKICEDSVTYLSDNTVLVRCIYYQYGHINSRLHFFKIDDRLSTIEFIRSIVIPMSARYFGLVDGRIVFLDIGGHRLIDCKVINAIVQINEDYSFTKIENGAACLRHNGDLQCLVPTDGCGRWLETRLFYYYSLDVKPRNGLVLSEYLHLPSLWVFEMETQQWTNIILNVWPEKSIVVFHVDQDGVMTFLRDVVDVSKHLSCDVYVSRIPTKKPDKLTNLAWMQSKICGDNFSRFIKFTD